MRSFLLPSDGTAHTLAIKGDGLICLRYQRGTYPIGSGPLQMLHAEAWEDVAIRRIARAEEPPGAEELC